jgi:GT2 family glycosyltransferase
MRLSVIVVNFNSGELIFRCLERLRGRLPAASEVIVVDNASTDQSVECLEQARLIRNTANLGFARAVNQGLAVADGDYLLLLNPDCLVEDWAIEVALCYMDQNPDVSILGARVLRGDGRLDPPARRSFKTPSTYLWKCLGLSFLFPSSHIFGRYYLSYLPEDQITDVDSVVGAFLLTRRAVVYQIGPLDERFFMYCEDEDWCWRAKLAGGRVVYHPDVVVHHVKGSSTSQQPTVMAWQWHRSLIAYHRKNIAPRYPAAVNALVYGGILAGLPFAVASSAARRLVCRR